MRSVPSHPKIYHITHMDNLSRIIDAGRIWSDVKRIELDLESENVGIQGIKQRRSKELEVKCHPGTKVGQYVPFNFCPRSIMLYILHKGNLPDLSYQYGQGPILHLQADLECAVQWADSHSIRWAFSDRNAGARIAKFFSTLPDLYKIEWKAISSTDWSEASIKDSKQAEFLFFDSFPWNLVEKIGVMDHKIEDHVNGILSGLGQKKLVTVERSWYY
ncbi:MAG: DUF4433 domain-containing protein [Planctomycetota bacterium]